MGEGAGWSPNWASNEGLLRPRVARSFPPYSQGHGLNGSPTAPVGRALCSFPLHPLNGVVACQLSKCARPMRVFRFLISLLEGVAKAALYCAHRTSTSDRARSGSKKDTWPLPPYSSEAARCAIFPSTRYGHGLIGSPTAPIEQSIFFSPTPNTMGRGGSASACAHATRAF